MQKIEKQTLYRYGLALCSGLCLSGSFAPDNLPVFAFAALLVISYLGATVKSAKDGALIGWLFGFGWFVAGIDWVQYSMHHYGALSASLSWALTVLLALFLGLFPAGAFCLASRLTDVHIIRAIVTIPAAFTAFEWLREWLFTGFPWLNPAYAFIDWTIAGWAPFAGVFAVLYALMLTAGLLCAAWMQWGRWVNVASMLIVCIAVLMIGYAGRMMPWAERVDTVSLYLVQPNLDPLADREHQNQRLTRIMAMLEQAENAPEHFDAALLPESVFALAWQDFHAVNKQQLISWVNRTDTTLFFNAFFESEPQRYANAAFMLAPQAGMTVYEKRHLVPFGEFVPWGFHGLVHAMAIPMTDLKAGQAQQPLMTIKNHPVSLNLCYENLFGSQWREAWLNGQQPQLLINLSNLKWFGPKKAHYQHLQISQMRALESARALVSVTNSGMTALIDAQGKVLAQIEPDRVGHLAIEAPVMSAQMTPFIRLGNTPIILWIFLMLIATALAPFALKIFKKQ